MPTLPQKLAFVDIETTGGRSSYDRIIEIGIVRVENDTITDTFTSLINPGTYIPSEIKQLTGITEKDVATAPSFYEVADRVIEILKDTVFVAHNVRFDYGFLKSEFKRLERSFSQKHFCTVRLSRALFPHERHHNLDSLISRMNYTIEKRHRAFDDAKVLFHFYQKVKNEIPPPQFEAAMQLVLKKPYLPVKLSEKILESLPEQPGVYIFYGSLPEAVQLDSLSSTQSQTLPLYIGKSINIKERVLSHFSGDIHSPLEMKIAQQVESIETIPTAGELGALFLESQLVKKRLPLLNRQLRLKKELTALKKSLTKEGYATVILEVLHSPPVEELDNFIGFFRSKKQAKDFLSYINKEHSLCEKLLGLEKTPTSCFGYRLERCKGACVGKEIPISYNMRFAAAFADSKIRSWPFKGPIVIEEKNELEDKTEFFLVDRWCLLGTVSTDSLGSIKETRWEYEFDLDTYKILSRFLRNPKNAQRIKEISTNSKEISASEMFHAL